VNSWTGSVDIDTYVVASTYRSIYRDRDIMSAPGGEVVSFTPQVDYNGNPETFLVYTHSYGMPMT